MRQRSKKRTDQGKLEQLHLLTTGGNSAEADFRQSRKPDATRLLLSILALSAVKGIGFQSLCAIFDAGHLIDLWDWQLEELEERLTASPIKLQPGLVKVIYGRRAEVLSQAQETARELEKRQIALLVVGGDDYPTGLTKLKEPPRWLFVRGTLQALHADAIVAVVGTRNASLEGQRLAYWCARELVSRNVVVLSGLAKGIDEKAHLGAVHYFGQTIAILGHGLSDEFEEPLWQRILATGGAIVSEYLPKSPPTRDTFLRRNELQVALSNVVIPVECPSMNSGTGATIRRAITQKVPVIGLVPEHATEPALLSTQTNLKELGFMVVPGGNGTGVDPMIDCLSNLIPDHDWRIDPKPRQDRFFDGVERQVLDASARLPLDEAAITRFSARVKRKIRNKAAEATGNS